MRKIKYSSTDFTANQLPKNRLAQFDDIFKLEWKTLLLIGIMLFAFFIPEMILLIFKNYYLVNLKSIVEEAEFPFYQLVTNLIVDAIQIVTFAVFSLGFSGILRIFRHLTWGEQVYFFSDFTKGIKTNFKTVCLVFIFCDLMLATNHLLSFVSSEYLSSPSNVIVMVIIDFIQFFLILPACFYIITSNNIYQLSLKQSLINSFVLLFKSYLFTFWVVALPAGIYFIYLIPSPLITGFATLLYFLIIVPLLLLTIYLIHIKHFDAYINNNYPEILNKGLSTYQNQK